MTRLMSLTKTPEGFDEQEELSRKPLLEVVRERFGQKLPREKEEPLAVASIIVITRVRREVGKDEEVIFEERFEDWEIHGVPLNSWTCVDDGLEGFAHKLLDLKKLVDGLEQATVGGIPSMQLAHAKWNYKKARRRLERLANERDLTRLRIRDDESRHLVRSLLQPSACEPEEPLDADFDVLSWALDQISPGEMWRLSRARPNIVIGEIAEGLWRVLGQASTAFMFSLFRLAMAGCRTIVEEVVEEALFREWPWPTSAGAKRSACQNRCSVGGTGGHTGRHALVMGGGHQGSPSAGRSCR